MFRGGYWPPGFSGARLREVDALRRSRGVATGTLRVSRGGTASVVPDGGGPQILLSRSPGLLALAGDRVEASVRQTKWGPRGLLIGVVEARTSGALGVVEKSGMGFRVALDRRDLPSWLNVGRSRLAGAGPGDRVWVEVMRDGAGSPTANCAVKEVLGPAEDPATDFRAVTLQFGLHERFPSEAMMEAGGIDERRAGRDYGADLRERLVFTVDPADAKDHDDALSYRDMGGGLVEVGVYIADVSRYVPCGGPVDVEAKERGTSVYLCDGVLPMLPQRLSEDLCSLLPDRDRLTLGIIFVMDRAARVKGREFISALVRSKARLSYEDAQAYLDGAPDGGLLSGALRELAGLAGRLAEARAARGALSLDVPEPEVHLDDRGMPTGITREKRLESHRIIEEFMLLANETVAAEAARRRIPFIYRNHPPPKEEKLEELALKLGEMGVRFAGRSVRVGRDLEAPLERISGERRRALGSYLVLRAMERARYAPAPSLHFGLASERYCHFTSPIRRYPDLFNHRALASLPALGGASRSPSRPDARGGSDPEGVSETSSAAEARADAAERQCVEIKCIRFMESRLGESFDGIVTDVTGPGYTVELDDYPVEGFVRRPAAPRRRARGGERARAGGPFLGDSVRVRVVRADPLQRELELVVVKKD